MRPRRPSACSAPPGRCRNWVSALKRASQKTSNEAAVSVSIGGFSYVVPTSHLAHETRTRKPQNAHGQPRPSRARNALIEARCRPPRFVPQPSRHQRRTRSIGIWKRSAATAVSINRRPARQVADRQLDRRQRHPPRSPGATPADPRGTDARSHLAAAGWLPYPSRSAP